MSVTLPEITINAPTLPKTADTTTAVVTETPYTKDYLNEIASLLQSPKKSDLVKSLFLRSNLVPLLETCANETERGREVLADLARAEPELLEQFVEHRLMLDSNPVIRKICIQCIYDLIDGTNTVDICNDNEEKQLNNLVRPIRFSGESRSSAERRPYSRQSSEPNLLKPNTFLRKDERKLQFGTLKRESVSLPLETSSLNDLELDMNMQVIQEDSKMLPLHIDLKHMISEDLAPDLTKSKDSSSWFIQNRDKMSGRKARLDGSLLNLDEDDDSDSESAEVNILSPSDKEKHEVEWLESVRGSKFSLNSEVRPSILKGSVSFNSKYSQQSETYQPYKVPDSPQKNFMYRLGEFGILNALSDLASLDPHPSSCHLAERTLQLLFQRAPDGLLNLLPKVFGKFSRVSRRLKSRSASRPIHLNQPTKDLMQDLWGGLLGRTLVVGGGDGVLSEKLMSYFYGHCNQDALELIISVIDDTITHLSRHPGFSDTYHKLCQSSNVNFVEEREYKEYDPGDNPNVLANAVKSKTGMSISTKFMFGVDATKLGSDVRLKDSEFNNVFFYFSQVRQGVAAQSNKSLTKIADPTIKDLVAGFLDSVVDILDERGCVHIGLDDVDQTEKWDLDEVAKEASFNIVARKELPSHLYRRNESSQRGARFSKATIYVLKVLGLGITGISDPDTYSDDTYSEPSS